MKIGVVNDLSIAVEAIRRVLEANGHRIAWVARNGAEAVEQCARARPDLVLMDLIMPTLNGVESVRRIMKSSPCPILVVTADLKSNSAEVFQALGAGALDAVETPILGARNSAGPVALLRKVEEIGRRLARPHAPRPQEPVKAPASRPVPAALVAIGASAGGPAAVSQILRALPRDFPGVVVIVQHLDRRFVPELAEWLAQFSSLPVRIARRGDVLEPGVVFLANTERHLVLGPGAILNYVPNTGQCAHSPSIDIFFRSVVQHWKGPAVGVLLTGMGRDGAEGLRGLKSAGYRTIIQDRESSVVYGMPKAAADLSAATETLPLSRIAATLSKNPAVKTAKLARAS